MKKVLGGVVTFSTLMTSSMGAPVCKNAAIRVAKQYSKSAAVVSSVAVLPGKTHLETYRVAMLDTVTDKTEVLDVTLSKKDSSLISVIPRV